MSDDPAQITGGLRWKISGRPVPLGRLIGQDGEHIDDLGLCPHCADRITADRRALYVEARR